MGEKSSVVLLVQGFVDVEVATVETRAVVDALMRATEQVGSCETEIWRCRYRLCLQLLLLLLLLLCMLVDEHIPSLHAIQVEFRSPRLEGTWKSG